jgi:hypothetical protein
LWDERVILAEARFYSIEPHVYTSVTDHSLLEIMEQTKQWEREEIYNKYASDMEYTKEIILKKFVEQASKKGSDRTNFVIQSPAFYPSIQEINEFFPKHELKEVLETEEKNQTNCFFVSKNLIDHFQLLVDHLKQHHSISVRGVVTGSSPQIFHPKNFEKTLTLADIIHVVFYWSPSGSHCAD